MNAETLIGRTRNLQAPPHTVARLLSLLSVPEPDYEEVISIVGSDPVLTANILALCNSATYGLAQPVSSVNQAVLCLGFREIHGLVMAIGFGSQVSVELPGYGITSGGLWRHSLVTALLAPRVLCLAKTLGFDDATAYTAGLVHDIGKLAIGEFLDEKARAEVLRNVEQHGTSLLDAERSVIGCDHAEVGAVLLMQWGIPEVIVDAVRHHHNPRLDRGAPLSAVVHVADAIAHQTGASPGWGSFAIVIHQPAIQALNLSGEDLENLTFAALDSQQKVLDLENAVGSPRGSRPKSAPTVQTSF